MGLALVSPNFRQAGMLYLAIGIIGATVMPHNLYLHSALVQTRRLGKDERSIRRGIRFNTIDSVVALTVAFFVNAAIMVLAAIVFFGKESVTVPGGAVVPFSPDSDWIRIAYLTLAPLLGTAAASTLFAVALFASGQSSTITGTLAGQVVMEGFMHWRISPWVRRLITRTLAILPAVFVIGLRGDSSVTDLLTLSQVVLALQLPLGHVSPLAFHVFPQENGQMETRLVLADRRVGQRGVDYGDGHLRFAGLAATSLEGHPRGMTALGGTKGTPMYKTILVTLGRHSHRPGDYRTRQEARKVYGKSRRAAPRGDRRRGPMARPGRRRRGGRGGTGVLERA